VVAGALNAVAGGGSFITLPMLIYGGVSPVMANATSTMALWPGSVSSALGRGWSPEVRDCDLDRGFRSRPLS
jgi:uncharacterized membrane protein YfcA